ncbi:MAG: hypothetical protein M3P29_00995 [Acidobacteriota bacterium]|nr:hypothetical protein [Acidobacteriota bacterium]
MARPLAGLHDHMAQALDHQAVMHGAVDLGGDRLLARMLRLEQLHYSELLESETADAGDTIEPGVERGDPFDTAVEHHLGMNCIPSSQAAMIHQEIAASVAEHVNALA